MKERYFEEALISLLKIGQGIAIDCDNKKVLLYNNGIQIEELVVEKFTGEEAERMKHGTLIDFSNFLELQNNTAPVS